MSSSNKARNLDRCRGRRTLTKLVTLVAICLTPTSCTTSRSDSYEPAGEESREPLQADQLARKAATFLDRDPDRAESMLREALNMDLFNGPAHNNLGVLYLAQDKLYEAAAEFEWARKLMPGNPDPRLNLALTLERAGHMEESLTACRAALEVRPEDVGAMQQIARITLQTGRTDSQLGEFLRVIAIRGESPRWRSWAKERLAILQG